MKPSGANRGIWVALLTGGNDGPYVCGLSNELPSKGTVIDLIGSNELDAPQVRGKAGLNFFKFRVAQDPKASFSRKVRRICAHYAKLM